MSLKEYDLKSELAPDECSNCEHPELCRSECETTNPDNGHDRCD